MQPDVMCSSGGALGKAGSQDGITPINSLSQKATVGVESGRGRNPTLRVCPMPFDDVGDGIFADAKVAGDPTIALPAVDGMEHLRGEPV